MMEQILESQRKAYKRRRLRQLKRARGLGWLAFLFCVLLPFPTLVRVASGDCPEVTVWISVVGIWVMAYYLTLKLAEYSLELGYLEGGITND